jgi:hypothetical protein
LIYNIAVFIKDTHTPNLTHTRGVFKLTSEQWKLYESMKIIACSDESVVDWLNNDTEKMDPFEASQLLLMQLSSVIVL